MKDRIIIEHFWVTGSNGDVSLRESDLGWPKALVLEAQSDYPETIFRTTIEILGFNLLFYWTVDENFYTIETEKLPIEVRRIARNPDWDGKIEFQKACNNNGPNTASPGEIIATYEDPTQIWGELHINGVPIHEVLEKSLIVNWD